MQSQGATQKTRGCRAWILAALLASVFPIQQGYAKYRSGNSVRDAVDLLKNSNAQMGAALNPAKAACTEGAAPTENAAASQAGTMLAEAALSLHKATSPGFHCWRGVKDSLCKAIQSTCGKFDGSDNAREAAELIPQKLPSFKKVRNSGNPIGDPKGTLHVYKDTATCKNKKGEVIECPGHVDIAAVDEKGKPVLVSDFRASSNPSSRFVLIATISPTDAGTGLSSLDPDTSRALFAALSTPAVSP